MKKRFSLLKFIVAVFVAVPLITGTVWAYGWTVEKFKDSSVEMNGEVYINEIPIESIQLVDTSAYKTEGSGNSWGSIESITDGEKIIGKINFYIDRIDDVVKFDFTIQNMDSRFINIYDIEFVKHDAGNEKWSAINIDESFMSGVEAYYLWPEHWRGTGYDSSTKLPRSFTISGANHDLPNGTYTYEAEIVFYYQIIVD